jgi:hypothetical protein
VRLTQRGLQLALAVGWLVNAGLQAQHFMFTSAFAAEVISPAGDNQPTFVAGPVHTVAGWVGTHPAIWNAAVVTLQALIGLGMLTRRFARPALAASVLWSLSVWWLAEGFGGIFGGGSNLVTGAPGAAVLYAVLALAAWPQLDRLRSRWSAQARRPPAGWLVAVWALVWTLGAIAQVWTDQRDGPDLAARLAGAGTDAPSWLYRLDGRLARWVGHTGLTVVLCLAAAEALIGLGALRPGRSRMIACAAGIVLAAAFWVVGQGLAGITTGHATDPGTGPLLVLMGVAVLASNPVRRGNSSRRRLGAGRRSRRP